MRNRYLIMMYDKKYDAWRTVNYSDIASATVFDDDVGMYRLKDAEKVWNLIADTNDGDAPVIMVEILRDNKIEAEYK